MTFFKKFLTFFKHQKCSSLFIFLNFNAIHLKFCNNIELTIPKTHVFFCFSDFGFFGGKNDITKFLPNIVLSIIGYLMMVSKRTHYKDVKSETFLKYAYPVKRCSIL